MLEFDQEEKNNVTKLLMYFLLAFACMALVRKFAYHAEDNWIDDLFHLRISGSTTWY